MCTSSFSGWAKSLGAVRSWCTHIAAISAFVVAGAKTQAPPQVRDDILNGTRAECIEGLTELAQRAQQPARGLNENYARELMELHTLGVDGGYTQQDVVEVARALTGWTINQQVGAFRFDPTWHDAGAKTVLNSFLSRSP